MAVFFDSGTTGGEKDAAAGVDAQIIDADLSDSGQLDTGLSDSGQQDSGIPPDSGIPADSGVPLSDAGVPGMGDIWVEIDYSSAATPSSPAFTYSTTPGWGEAQSAMAGDGWPEAWDRWNNMQVVSDPIGTVLEIGSSSELQLMIGLEELLSYTSASVHLEGRSLATSSSVDFDVYNPLSACGGSGNMAQDWTIHAVDVDVSTCMVIGEGVQAIRVEPTNGTVALVRMRLTIYGASW